eukprot:TRINITY_DN15924_c0_g1_i1.p1 TRINITY_DN15924_c0_g1~~TRINITY_DN15924_c0_g1_i1.p1  ORF type:complete len:479 (+),score=126.81 TRINITY_DN15924_c0_g1_i1:242-1678(+)
MDPAALVQGLRSTFRTGKTRPFEWRKQQLKAMIKMVRANEKALCDAVFKDLGKPPFETIIAELNGVCNVAREMIGNLPNWMKPQTTAGNVLVFPSTNEIYSEPLGVCLVIAPWNYPALLSLEPMIGALAAGNTVLLKPSEISAHTSALLSELIPKYLDTEAVKVFEGGVPETTALLAQKFDHIFYTGGTMVGKIIMAAAAKHLTPVVLELGGKSPAYVDSVGDYMTVARRMLGGKLLNAGQTCTAPDYVLVQEANADKLIDALKKVVDEFYNSNPEKSPDFARIISARQWQRLVDQLDAPQNKKCIVYGGERNEATKFIAPTFLKNVPEDSKLMQEEIFGPILPIQIVRDMHHATEYILDRPKPLSLYVFTDKKDVAEHFIHHTSSGSICVNDTVVQVSVAGLPFGGVGDSGMGAYHGKYSFDTFSHKKAVCRKVLAFDADIRYPPYTPKKQSITRTLMRGDYWGVLLAVLGFRKVCD